MGLLGFGRGVALAQIMARAAASMGVASQELQQGEASPGDQLSRCARLQGGKVGKPSPGANGGTCGAGVAAQCSGAAACWRPAGAWLLGGGARDGAA